MDMDKLVALCRRRGFLFQSSEIYGGLNGFWDYGPLGVELKRNIKEAWWRDMVTGAQRAGEAGRGAVDVRNGRPRLLDHHAPAGVEVLGALRFVLRHDDRLPADEEAISLRSGSRPMGRVSRATGVRHHARPRMKSEDIAQRAQKFFKLRAKDADKIAWDGGLVSLAKVERLAQGARARGERAGHAHRAARIQSDVQDDRRRDGHRGGCGVSAPRNGPGHLRQFQERAATARACGIPFGIAQVGKSFRNEITPRNFTFRSREFEQMEIEFFCHPTNVAASGTSIGAIGG